MITILYIFLGSVIGATISLIYSAMTMRKLFEAGASKHDTTPADSAEYTSLIEMGQTATKNARFWVEEDDLAAAEESMKIARKYFEEARHLRPDQSNDATHIDTPYPTAGYGISS